MINKNGHWTYENITLTIPDEGTEGYIQNNRGKIIRFILWSSIFWNRILKKCFTDSFYWGTSFLYVLPHFWSTNVNICQKNPKATHSSLDHEATKIRPNFRKQTISKIEISEMVQLNKYYNYYWQLHIFFY